MCNYLWNLPINQIINDNKNQLCVNCRNYTTLGRLICKIIWALYRTNCKWNTCKHFILEEIYHTKTYLKICDPINRHRCKMLNLLYNHAFQQLLSVNACKWPLFKKKKKSLSLRYTESFCFHCNLSMHSSLKDCRWLSKGSAVLSVLYHK